MDKHSMARKLGLGELFEFHCLGNDTQKEASIIVDRISGGSGDPRRDYLYGFDKKGKLSVVPCNQHITSNYLRGK